MKIQINRSPYNLLDGGTPSGQVTIEPGVYEARLVPNPHGHDAPWIVLEGTLTGASEGSLRQWVEGMELDKKWKERVKERALPTDPWVVVYDDNGNIMPPKS